MSENSRKTYNSNRGFDNILTNIENYEIEVLHSKILLHTPQKISILSQGQKNFNDKGEFSREETLKLFEME